MTLSTHLSHHEKLWLSQSLSQVEAEAWLDDKASLARLAAEIADKQYSAEALILERSRLLAEDNATATSIAREIQRVQPSAKILAYVFAIVATASGVVTASAVLSDVHVNVTLAWFALLGPHFISLIAWIAGFFLGKKSAGFSLGSLWGSATKRFSSSEYTPLIFRAMTSLIEKTRLLYWTYSSISHVLWSLFFVGAIIGLSYLLMIREYSFRWETTILSSEFIASFVAFFGWLPKLIGFQIPEYDVVITLPSEKTARTAWSVWLLCCVIFYGLVPRTLLAIDSVRRFLKGKRNLSLDLESPYYVKLRQRLDLLLRPPLVITDPNTGVPDLTTPTPSDHPAIKSREIASPLLFALELHDDVVWPPTPLPNGITVTENISSPDSRDALLTKISAIKPHRTVVTCEARATPDRGSLYLIKEVSTFAGTIGVLLLNQSTARPDRARYWKEELVELGIKEEYIFSELSDSLAWLRDANA